MRRGSAWRGPRPCLENAAFGIEPSAPEAVGPMKDLVEARVEACLEEDLMALITLGTVLSSATKVTALDLFTKGEETGFMADLRRLAMMRGEPRPVKYNLLSFHKRGQNITARQHLQIAQTQPIKFSFAEDTKIVREATYDRKLLL